MSKAFNVVLVNPEIPQNTGNIGRLCVSTDTKLHLIKPLGYSLEDKYLRRAGMDYWKYADKYIYENWQEFIDKNPLSKCVFMSTKGEKSFWNHKFTPGSFLVFGNESRGFPKNFYNDYKKQLRTIPMNGKYKRSLNLANAVSISLFEALRQNK